MTSSITHRKHRFENNLQTFFLIGSMVLLLGALGYTLGGWGWLLVFAVFAAITMCLAPRIGPAILFRFYRAQPISPRNSPRLYRLLVELSRRAGLERAPALYYIPSKIHNAFAVGLGPQASIGITDGLLRDFSARELAGILAHEISHIRNRDTAVMGLADAISRFATFLSRLGIFLVFLNLPLILMGYARISWIAVLLMVFSPTIAALLQLGLSRTREYAADADAALLTGDPEGLASALAKLERIHGNAWEDVFLSGRRHPEPSLLRTHPPTDDRIRRLLALREKKEVREVATRPPIVDVDRARELLQSFIDGGTVPEKPRWHLFGTWY